MEFLFNDCQRQLDELLEDHICDTLSAVTFLSVVELEDREVLEDAFSEMEKCHITLDVSKLPPLPLTGSSALRLKQESQWKTLDKVTDELEENDPLLIFLQELAATPAAGDIQLYAQRYAEGEHHLAEAMVNLCLRTVLDMALENTGHGILLLDLIQEGSLGLWESITRYENGDFMTHARWWIHHFMAKAIVFNAHSVGQGKELRHDMELYQQADRQLLAELGRNPTADELAERLGLTMDELQAIEKLVKDAAVNKLASAPEEDQPAEDPEEEQSVENTAYFQLRQHIAELLASLSPTDARILTLRFGLEGGKPKTPVETGKILDLTPAEVLQREAAALEKLRGN